MILINFWATYCVPCIEEFPMIVDLSKKYSEKGMQIYFVSADWLDRKKEVRDFLLEKDVKGLSFIKEEGNDNNFINEISREWSGALPFTIVYDKNGNLSFLNKYELIINCDHINMISKKYFSKKIVKKYNSSAFTTVIKHKKILNDTAIQVFTTKGPLAFLPISNTETSVVYSVYGLADKHKKNIEELIRFHNYKYKISKIEKISSFELMSLHLRSYYHNNILAFGDALHKIHPLAGQGFNMTIRDIRILTKIIINRCKLGLPLDSSINEEFENSIKHKNFIFSNGVDLIHEFFKIERKTKSNILSKSVQFIGKNSYVNKMFAKIADKGILF